MLGRRAGLSKEIGSEVWPTWRQGDDGEVVTDELVETGPSHALLMSVEEAPEPLGEYVR